MEKIIQYALFALVLGGSIIGLAPLAQASANPPTDSFCQCITTCSPLTGTCWTNCYGDCR